MKIFFLMLIPMILASCAHFTPVSVSDANLTGKDRVEFENLIKLGDEEKIGEFINDNSRAIRGYDLDVTHRGVVYEQAILTKDGFGIHIYMPRSGTYSFREFTKQVLIINGSDVVSGTLEYITTPITNPWNSKPLKPLCSEKNGIGFCRIIKDSDQIKIGPNDADNLADTMSDIVLPIYIKKALADKIIQWKSSYNFKLQAEKAAKELSTGLDETRQKYEKYYANGCVKLTSFNIVQKLGQNTFEISTPCCGRDSENNCTLRTCLIFNNYEPALLATNESKFTSAGFINLMYVKAKGRKAMALKNGFTKSVDIFEESSECAKIANP